MLRCHEEIKPVEEQQDYQRASIWKRLAATVYDYLIAVAIAMLTGLLVSVLLNVAIGLEWLSAEGANSPSEAIAQSWLYQLIIQTSCTVAVVYFFLWFWMHGGQTLGMRAWRLRLFVMDDRPVTYSRLLFRLLSTLLGLGTIFMIVTGSKRLALQDQLSRIEVIALTKEQNDHKSW